MQKLPVVPVVPNTKPDASTSHLSNAWASITLILNQFPNIADGWNSINDAKYKIEKFQVIMQIINSNVDKMADGVTIIEDLKNVWTSTASDKADVMIRIRTEVLRIHGLYATTKTKIGTNIVKMLWLYSRQSEKLIYRLLNRFFS